MDNVVTVEAIPDREASGGLAAVSTSLREVLDSARDLAESSANLVEDQVSAGIRLAERLMDSATSPEVRARSRQTGVLAEFREDTHQAVDVLFDTGAQLLAAAAALLDSLTGDAEPVRLSPLQSSLTSVEGIGRVYARRLHKAGIRRCADLLAAGATAEGREQLARTTGISPRRLTVWVNHVDLFRVEGVGEEYADLLEAAGVESVPELARQKADKLHRQLAQTNVAQRRVRRLPALAEVTAWIERAAALPPLVSE